MSLSEPSIDAARLLARGQPVHSRTFVIEVFRDDADTLRAEGEILDLRKCGFVPGAGDLQTAGFIHQMKITAWLGAEDRVLRRLAVDQPKVAYEADAETTRGECCRDPAPRLQALVGTRFDAGFAPRLREVFAGPLGCSHLLTLGQLMSGMLPMSLDREKTIAPKGLSERVDGELLFKRVLTLDGLVSGEDHMDLAAQMTDYHMAPHAQIGQPFDRLARQHEIHVLARVDLSGNTVEALDAAERLRSWAGFGDESWSPVSERVAPLVGGPALRGFSREVFRQLGDDSEQAPLRDVLLNLGPCLIQCFAATSIRWMARLARQRNLPKTPKEPGDGPDMTMMGGFPDSCYLWRSDGAMAKRRAAPNDSN
ncbi:MAG: DUF2889 domain-containing protein [Deltaproteobacteria bacterium]|nr:DUF2889 domain-containing protein [Deltaproteobacteria bacterium]MBW2392935.1 DUF2889 domain-containing protein [Deltaproteobacteria bacterium]